MKISRKLITPYLTWTFFVIGISGILMFFHVLDGYTEVVHEFLGLLFTIFAILHTVLNWKSLKSHFKKKIFVNSFIVVSLVSVLFIYLGIGHGEPERIIMEKLTKADINRTFSILDIDYFEAEKILKSNNILIGKSRTIEEVGLKNQLSPEEIIELILK